MKKSFLLLTLFMYLSRVCFAQDIYTYVNSTAGTPTYVDALIPIYSGLTAIGTGVITPCTWGFSGIDGFTGGVYVPSGPCIQVSLTAAAGYTIDVTGFTAGLRRSTTGPARARMAYSIDGGASWIDEGVDHTPLNASCATSPAGTTLANWSTLTVTNPAILFRIYPFGASGSTGTIQIYGLDIIGNVHLLCTAPTVSVLPATGSFCSGGAGIGLTASGGITYTWSPVAGLSASTGASVTAVPAVTTVYTVTGSVAGGCSAVATATVTVNPLPPVAIATTGFTSFCNGDSVVFTATAGYDYQWYNGASAISGATDALYTAYSSGSYKVTLTNSFGCSATSAPIAVTNFPIPAAAIVAGGLTSICPGSNVRLDATIGAGFTYRWFNTGVLITGSTGAFYNAATAGDYAVEITGAGGCMDTSSVVVVAMYPAPVTTAAPAGATTFCAGGSVVLDATPGYTYQWYYGATAIAGATNTAYSAAATGSYAAEAMNMYGCTTLSAPVAVIVNPLPFIAITPMSPTTFCAGGSVALNATVAAGYIYQWSLNGVDIPGATTASYLAMAMGAYTVRVTNANSCVNTASSVSVVLVSLPTIVTTYKTSFCAGSNALLATSVSGTLGVTYQWQKNGVSISAATSGLYSVSAPGAYTCVVNVSGSCISETPPIIIVVYPAPHPVVTFADTALVVNSRYPSYQWYVNLVGIPGAMSTSWKPRYNGSYRIRVVDTNGCPAYSNEVILYTVGVEALADSKDYSLFPNPAGATVHISAPQPVRAVITGMEGRVMIDLMDAKHLDLSPLPAGMYMISLYDDSNVKVYVQKLLKQ